MQNTFSGLETSNPTAHRAVLEARLTTIDRRRAIIEAQLDAMQKKPSHRTRPDSFHSQELEAELRDLNRARRETEAILRPAPAPARSPGLQRLYERQRLTDVHFLRTTIKQQTEQIEAACEKLDASGDHRQARLHRMQIPDLPELICQQFGKDPALLAEIDDEAKEHSHG